MPEGWWIVSPRAGTPEYEELFRKFVEEEYLREGLDT